MKNSIYKSVFLVLLFGLSQLANAQTAVPKSKVVGKSMPNQITKNRPLATSKKVATKSAIATAVNQIKNGQNLSAANNLLSLSRRPEYQNDKSQIKFLLGLALMEMNLNQVAAFQFVDVVKSGDARFLKKALEKLFIVTDKLGDETMLNYAIQRIDISSLPASNQELLYYRLAEIKQKAGLFNEANQLYSKVNKGSRYYLNSLYNLGLVQAEAGQLDLALSTFSKLRSSRNKSEVTDTNRVASLMATARTLYQKKDWEKSIDAYALIPRDHPLWHDAVFEQSWAMLRAARFRSALSNFQTLHSSFYDDFYIPESLILRSIVYLYICKYDEMEKVLSLFDKQYGPVLAQILKFNNSGATSLDYFREIEKAYVAKTNGEVPSQAKIPFKATRHIVDEGNIKRSLSYIRKIQKEKKAIEEDSRIRSLGIGSYSLKLINNRLQSAKIRTGDLVKAHLLNMTTELKDLKDQGSLVRYEMINGQKETLKKKIAEKDVKESSDSEPKTRSFYAQNGYEFYPFQGEFWLDEVGNYHYLGKQSCE